MKSLLFLSVFLLGTYAEASTVEVTFDKLSGDTSYLVRNPTHRGSGLPFDYYSADNGVCQYLGYERAASESKRIQNTNKGETITIDNRALVTEAKSSIMLHKIVCINKSTMKGEVSSVILNPLHADSMLPLSYYSNESGTCKYLGHSRAAPNSRRLNNTKKNDTIILGADGNVHSAPIDYILTRIVCLD